MTSGEVVGGVFLSGDELLRVEKLSVGTSSDLINDGRFQIKEDSSSTLSSSSPERKMPPTTSPEVTTPSVKKSST